MGDPLWPAVDVVAVVGAQTDIRRDPQSAAAEAASAQVMLNDFGRRPYRGRCSFSSSSPSIMAWIKPRTRSRTAASIGSNQSSKRYTAVSATGCEESDFVVMLFMAWSP